MHRGGRFLKEDPIGFEGGLNLSLYAGGNPIAFVDPSGLSVLSADLSLNIPSWLKYITGSEGQGASIGIGVSLPDIIYSSADGFSFLGEFDIGIIATLHGAGEDYGTGRASVGVSYDHLSSIRSMDGEIGG